MGERFVNHRTCFLDPEQTRLVYRRKPTQAWAVPLLTLPDSVEALYARLTGQPPVMNPKQLGNSLGSLLEMTAVALFDSCKHDHVYHGMRVSQGLPARSWEGLNSHPALCGDFDKVRLPRGEGGKDEEASQQQLEGYATGLTGASGLPCRICSLNTKETVPFGMLELGVGTRVVSCSLPDRVFDDLQGADGPRVKSACLIASPASAPVYVRGASHPVAALLRDWDVQLSCGGKSTSITSAYVKRIPPAGMAVLFELLASILDIKTHQERQVTTESYTLDCLYSSLVSAHGSHTSAYRHQGRASFVVDIALPSKQDDQDIKWTSLALTPDLPKARESGPTRIRLRYNVEHDRFEIDVQDMEEGDRADEEDADGDDEEEEEDEDEDEDEERDEGMDVNEDGDGEEEKDENEKGGQDKAVSFSGKWQLCHPAKNFDRNLEYRNAIRQGMGLTPFPPHQIVSLVGTVKRPLPPSIILHATSHAYTTR
ncbi:unnamed protein product [Sympodiomycopsis kandeliae]